MQMAAVVMRWIVRIGGLIQIALGLTFWTQRGLSLIPIHMMIGLLVALGLATLGILAWRSGGSAVRAVVAILWALALPVFGFAHIGLLPGKWHWVIRVLHLAIGIGALGFADRLAEQALSTARIPATRAPAART